MPGSAFRRVLCQLPGREQVILVSRDFAAGILCPPSPGGFNSGVTSTPLVLAVHWAPLQLCDPVAFPWCSETMISCLFILHWFEKLHFFHLPPPHFLFFPGLFLILHQLPNLVHCGTVWTAEWAQWEGREQGDGQRTDRKGGGKTPKDNTWTAGSIVNLLLSVWMCFGWQEGFLCSILVLVVLAGFLFSNFTGNLSWEWV